MNIKNIGFVLNSFIHDFASGYWLSVVIVMQLLHRIRLQHPAVNELIREIQIFFFWNSVAAIIVVVATGAGRILKYDTNQLGEEVEPVRRRMLIIKHIVLLLVFGVGEWWCYLKAIA